ncbi:7553_t:CDS:2, partial [Gigaspora rosea]
MTRFLSLLHVIRHEILIMYNLSISDWMNAIISPIFMTIGALYMRIFSSIATYNGEFLEIILHIIFPFSQIASVEEDRINKPYRPIPSGLITIKGSKHRLVAISIIFPIIAYLIGAFGTLIQLASCHYIIIDTKLSIFELLNSELGIFKLGIFFFVMTTAQVQDLRDQKGDKFVGRKTLPLLIVEKKFEANINNGSVPYEFDLIEFILIALNASS